MNPEFLIEDSKLAFDGILLDIEKAALAFFKIRQKLFFTFGKRSRRY